MYIGLSGKMGVGKTTVAKFLTNMFPAYKKISFGDFLKKEVSSKFKFPLLFCYHQKDYLINHEELPKNPMTVREILQWWGDKRREEDRFYLVKKMMEIFNKYDKIIIDDVRMPEEANLILNYGGLLFRIHPYPGYIIRKEMFHETETSLDNFQGWHREFKPLKGLKYLEDIALKTKFYIPEKIMSDLSGIR